MIVKIGGSGLKFVASNTVYLALPGGDTIHLAMDSLSFAHQQRCSSNLGAEPGGWLWNRFTVHYIPNTWQLVEPGGNCHQPILLAMLGPTPHWRSSFPAEGNSGVELSRESRPVHDPVELLLASWLVTDLATRLYGHGISPRARLLRRTQFPPAVAGHPAAPRRRIAKATRPR